MDDNSMSRWQQAVRTRAEQFLSDADPTDIGVWYEEYNTDLSGESEGEDAFIVEWLAGPDYWSYPSLESGSFLPGTYTAPWDTRSLMVVITDESAVQ